MHRLVLGIVIGFLSAASLAWAFTVQFPGVLKIKGSATVDEAGNVLGGATPVAVTVANLPAESPCELASATVDAQGGSTANVMTVPPGKDFVLSDVSVGKTNDTQLILRDGTGGRFVFVDHSEVISLKTGIVFASGQTMTIGTISGNSLTITATVTGCLVPSA